MWRIKDEDLPEVLLWRRDESMIFKRFSNQFLTKLFLLLYKMEEKLKITNDCEQFAPNKKNSFALGVTIIENEPYKIGFGRQTDGSTREENDAEALEADQLLIRALTRQ